MTTASDSPKPCSDREHIDSIDKPGFCVWCDAPLKCKVCGVSKGHATSCPVAAGQRRTVQDETEHSLARELQPLLEAVQHGAHLTLQGPSPLRGNATSPPGAGTFVGQIESSSGARCQQSSRATLQELVADLAAKWRQQ